MIAAGSETAGPDRDASALGAVTSSDRLPGLISGLSQRNSVYRRMMTACDKLAGAAVQGADAVDLTRIFAETARTSGVLGHAALQTRCT